MCFTELTNRKEAGSIMPDFRVSKYHHCVCVGKNSSHCPQLRLHQTFRGRDQAQYFKGHLTAAAKDNFRMTTLANLSEREASRMEQSGHQFVFFFLFFSPVAYGSSQARGQIRAAAAASLHHSHSHAKSKPHR